jgi:hypothetical protein
MFDHKAYYFLEQAHSVVLRRKEHQKTHQTVKISWGCTVVQSLGTDRLWRSLTVPRPFWILRFPEACALLAKVPETENSFVFMVPVRTPLGITSIEMALTSASTDPWMIIWSASTTLPDRTTSFPIDNTPLALGSVPRIVLIVFKLSSSVWWLMDFWSHLVLLFVDSC